MKIVNIIEQEEPPVVECHFTQTEVDIICDLYDSIGGTDLPGHPRYILRQVAEQLRQKVGVKKTFRTNGSLYIENEK